MILYLLQASSYFFVFENFETGWNIPIRYLWLFLSKKKIPIWREISKLRTYNRYITIPNYYFKTFCKAEKKSIEVIKV